MIKIFLILFILNIVISQNIITSWHYDKVQMYEFQKIGNILRSQIEEKVITLPDFTEDSIKISNLKITEVQQALYDSYLNFKSGLLIFTPNKVSLCFNFSYSSQGESGSASFDLKINVLKMRLKNNKVDQTQSVEISMFSKEDDFSVFEISDKEFASKIKTSLYKGFEKNDILNVYISSKLDIISYYKNFYKDNHNVDFETIKLLDSKKISIKMNRFIGFCEDVTNNFKSGICYYSGELDEEDKKDKTNIPLSNEKFVYPNNTYNTFINIDLYNQILNKIMKDGLSEKTFNKDSVIKSLSYDFTVSSLKKYFDGLNDFENTESFEVKININELNSKLIQFSASFNIGSQTNVFTLDIKMDTSFKVEISKSVRINICLENIKNSEISIKNGNVSILDESGLKSAIEESFDNKNLPLCLTDDGIHLRDYYSLITNAYCRDEGIYLEGNQLYQ